MARASTLCAYYLSAHSCACLLTCVPACVRVRACSKATIKSEYLLTDDDIAYELKSLTRKNPHQPTWAPMKLFLKAEVRLVCFFQF